MSSIFAIFDIGVRAMYAQQTALQITGQNISNANNENYVRQRAELKEATPFNAVPGQLGSGVSIEQIIRIKDDFTDYQLQKENQNLGYLDEKNNILEQLENIFSEPSDNGLNSVISGFYDSLHDLSNYPENFSSRVMVREQGLTLCDSFNNTIDKINELKSNINENIVFKVDEINAITADIADLNNQISRAEVGGIQNANDLRNQRDALVRKLCEMGDIFVQEGDDNLLYVQLGDTIIVSGVHQIELKAQTDPENNVGIVSGDSNKNVKISNGSLKALFDTRDDVLDKYIDDLNTLARSIITELNDVHTGGIGLTMYQSATAENGAISSTVPLANAGYDFPVNGGSFTISLYDSARNLKSETKITINPFSDTLNDIAAKINAISGLNTTISSDNKLSIATSNPTDQFSFLGDSDGAKDTSNFLQAAGLNTFFKGKDASSITLADYIINDVNKIATGKSTAPGDNSNIIEMIGTRDIAFVDGAKPEDFFSSMIGDLGVERQVTIKRSETQQLILSSLEDRFQSQSGVSFDEEAINLIKYQRGYQAAAKFIQVMDGLINSLIQLM